MNKRRNGHVIDLGSAKIFLIGQTGICEVKWELVSSLERRMKETLRIQWTQITDNVDVRKSAAALDRNKAALL